MRVFVIATVAVLALAGCASDYQTRRTSEGALLGAAGGAIVGGLVTGNVKGAAAGAAIGGAGGAIIGAVASRPGYCYARDEFGQQIIVRCPPQY